MNSLNNISGLGDWGSALIPGSSIITGVLDIFKTNEQAQAAQQLLQQQAALAQNQNDLAQQQAVQAMVAQQVQVNNITRVATAAGALALFGLAGYFAWKTLKRK